jgi:hypothetical protein
MNNSCTGSALKIYKREQNNWVEATTSATTNTCQNKNSSIAIKPNAATTITNDSWNSIFNNPGKYRIVVTIKNYSGYPYSDFEVVAKVDKLPPTVAAAPAASYKPAMPAKKVIQSSVVAQPLASTTASTPNSPISNARQEQEHDD